MGQGSMKKLFIEYHLVQVLAYRHNHSCPLATYYLFSQHIHRVCLHFNHVSTTRRKLLHGQQSTRCRWDTSRYHLQWQKCCPNRYWAHGWTHSRGPSLVDFKIRVKVLIVARSGSSLTISAARPKPSLLRTPLISRLVMMALTRSRSSLLVGMIGPSLGKTTYIRLCFFRHLHVVHWGHDLFFSIQDGGHTIIWSLLEVAVGQSVQITVSSGSPLQNWALVPV